MRLIQFSLQRVSILLLSISLITYFGCKTSPKDADSSEQFSEEHEKYDGPAEIAAMEYRRTMDPALGRVPRERYMRALQQTIDSRASGIGIEGISAYGNWTERGPNSDAVGPSNGNTRANSGITSGRMRAILVDASVGSGNQVFVGGVDGGIWKTTDISASPATWTLVSDFFSNMAITSICQDPTTPATMYFSTGEWTYNADGVAGDGVWKSTNGGTSWTQLSSTTGANFDYCSKILCDAAGNVYVSTRNGIYRSTDGGTSWTTITPTGLANNSISDMELSSTGRLHISTGYIATCSYRYTDIPATVTSGAGWNSAAAGFPASSVRIELACSGSVLYALPSNGSYQVPTIYKSTDGGANWAATAGAPTSGWASGQAWYALAVDIDPSDPTNTAIVGGLEAYKTTNGGTSWTRISRWVGTIGQYVHADIHIIKYHSATRVLFGCDGGIHYSNDAGATIRDRNVGLRLKQFFSVAIHPSTTNYFLAGAQDNGNHQFSTAGLGATVEVMGGDGAFVHIDQDEPSYQYVSYIFNDYFRSTDGGSSWSEVDFGGSGQFINPTDFDDAANIMYCGDVAGSYRRWTNPHTGSTSAAVAITALNGNSVTAVTVSPYTSNRVYFGTENDVANSRVCYVDNANTTASGSAGNNISTGLPTGGDVSCIAVGTTDNNLMVTYSNYGVNQIWVSTNGGTSWTAIDGTAAGQLPDMPVRWAMFKPGDNTKAIIATETGVFYTQLINGASTAWVSSPTFPLVRTDMLQYRASDQIVAAATHGRGLWTQPIYSILPLNNFMLRGRWNNSSTTELVWDFEGSNTGGNFTVEYSSDGVSFASGGTVSTVANKSNYTFNHQPGISNVFYRIKHTSATGKILYSNILKLFKGSSGGGIQITTLYPNPVQSDLKVAFTNSQKGKVTYMITNMSGQVVWTQSEMLNYTGNNSKIFSQFSLRPGNYIFTITNGSDKVSQKFVKQ